MQIQKLEVFRDNSLKRVKQFIFIGNKQDTFKMDKIALYEGFNKSTFTLLSNLLTTNVDNMYHPPINIKINGSTEHIYTYFFLFTFEENKEELYISIPPEPLGSIMLQCFLDTVEELIIKETAKK